MGREFCEGSKSETVIKCFGKAGILVSSSQSESQEDNSDDDEDDNTPIAELIKLVNVTQTKIQFDCVMTASEYVDMDLDIPVNEDIDENWEYSEIS